ncbi:MAG: SEC-C domain-containing protein [Oscillochloris sp.]|nr:SEC-C domain-containing protein [Oscillochloris sp.]
MAKPAATRKLGRNDPCHCGSGKKYKDCHLPIEEAFRSEQFKLRQAQDSLLAKIVEAAQSLPDQFPPAFERFWDGKYSLDQMQELDDLEDRGAERFLIWFAFDYRQVDGRTLLEQLAQSADTGGFAVDPAERMLLERWRTVRLRPYQITAIRKGKGVQVCDLFSDQAFEVNDSHAAKRLELGELMVGHLVPGDTVLGADAPIHYLAGAAAQLTSDTAAKLLEFAELHLADLRRRAADAGWDDLIDERSEMLNHFVSALPREERDPSLLDDIILKGQMSLQLTRESVQQLLGRDQSSKAQPEAETDSDGADPKRGNEA